jgi:hypothetical protein
MYMKPSSISYLCAGALAIMTALCFDGCTLHWPGAPFTDTAAVLDHDASVALRSGYPDARLISPVFRRHLEKQQHKDHVTDQWFLFADASGRPHRGNIDAEGRLTVHPVTFLERLPEPLRNTYFAGKTPMVPGGQVSGRVWRFVDDHTGSDIYEFEFTHGTQRGVGQIDASGVPARADYIVTNLNPAQRPRNDGVTSH